MKSHYAHSENRPYQSALERIDASLVARKAKNIYRSPLRDVRIEKVREILFGKPSEAGLKLMQELKAEGMKRNPMRGASSEGASDQLK